MRLFARPASSRSSTPGVELPTRASLPATVRLPSLAWLAQPCIRLMSAYQSRNSGASLESTRAFSPLFWPEPMRPPRGTRRSGSGILTALFQVALGHAQGINLFGNTRQAFLSSLAPWLAIALVRGFLYVAAGRFLAGVSGTLATICALLLPAVLSFELARIWGRAALWPRFATAMNWCQWLLPILGMVLIMPAGIATRLGVPEQAIEVGLIAVIGIYAIWLHWFLARHALDLSAWRAGILVIVVNVGTGIIVLGPALLALNKG